MDVLCWCCLSPAWDRADSETTLSRKLTIVGDGMCGKTSLLVRISRDTFTGEDYQPTAFEKDVVDVLSGDRKVELVLQDSAGQESYDRLRHVVYTQVDVVLVCFALDSPASLVNVQDTWQQEVNYYCPGVPLILVGNKVDVRQASGLHPGNSPPGSFVTTEEGREVARRIGACAYIECSAKDGTNCKKLLGASVKQATAYRPFSARSSS